MNKNLSSRNFEAQWRSLLNEYRALGIDQHIDELRESSPQKTIQDDSYAETWSQLQERKKANFTRIAFALEAHKQGKPMADAITDAWGKHLPIHR